MVRKIIGRPCEPRFHHLSVDGRSVTECKDIADTLGGTFASHSSSDSYSEPFRRFRGRAEKLRLNFESSDGEYYNTPISLKELQDSLSEAKNTSPGHDGIPYQIVRELPPPCLQILLDLFNEVWHTGNFPKSWRKALVIPIPKPGKDLSVPSNYRPIALTSCLCKSLERILNKRLTYFLESNDIIDVHQCGFRRGRSTLDHLVRMESFIRDAFISKSQVTAVFFDLEKAYDTTWKYGIMKDLHDMGLRGNLPRFIQHFLDDRTFQVRLGSVLSDTHKQEMGVPQGSVLSVTLFSIKINSISRCLEPDVTCSLYVDDFAICYRSSYLPVAERRLQLCLSKLQKWADENGFRFSPAKTVAMHFSNRRGLHPDPELFLNGSQIPIVAETKFLGVIFDRKLSFIPHIKRLKAKCHKALNLLKVVGHYDWGADRRTLLNLYRTLVRSKLDYGSIVYGSARHSYVRILDPIQNGALRICLGAFRTSPADSLCVEAEEPPLDLRRLKLALQYAVKLKDNPSNPAYDVVFNPRCEPLYEGSNHIRPFGLRHKQHLDELSVNLDSILPSSHLTFPPWEYTPPVIDLSLASDKKAQTSSLLLRQRFLELRGRLYSHRTAIYTDGSKAGDKVAAAAFSEDSVLVRRLPNKSSVYSAELTALCLALQFIDDSPQDEFIIYSDSLSCLMSMKSSSPRNPLLQQLITSYMACKRQGNDIVLCWVPSHVGIRGNENADLAAKGALHLNISDMQVPASDFKACVKPYIYGKWQHYWDGCNANKLHEIHPSIGEWHHSNRKSRREETTLARLRIGHSHLTHAYLLRGEQAPECDLCGQQLTIKHILVECQQLAAIRRNHYSVGSLQELFQSRDPQSIIAFLKQTDLFKLF